MAERTMLSNGEQLLNVSRKVGPNADCPNNSNDVELVQRLLQIILKSSPENKGLPSTNGRFEAITGYYIYHLQASAQKMSQGMVVDGCVSHIRGGSAGYGAGGIYTIYYLNRMAKNRNPLAYEDLRRTFPMPPSGVR